MSKTKTDKRVNRVVKCINKELREDVFKDRFSLHQLKKARGIDNMQYYLYEMRDRLEPERNYIIPWVWGDSCFLKTDLLEELNNFIAYSNFWAIYHNNPIQYNENRDYFKNNIRGR